jgi:hypothetical protein
MEDWMFGAAVGTTRCQDVHLFSIKYNKILSHGQVNGKWLFGQPFCFFLRGEDLEIIQRKV